MFALTRPSPRDVANFLENSRGLDLSYSPIGLALPDAPAAGWQIDETVTLIGVGDTAFSHAKAALREWAHFATPWTILWPRYAAIEPGTNIAVLIHHLGFWSVNGSRVVYSIGDDAAMEFGFAYGTLTNHAEMGEEIFKVSIAPGTREVTYTIRAASRPRAPLAKLGYPVVRALQAKFRRDSSEALRRSVAERMR